jgi:hypothetical protein
MPRTILVLILIGSLVCLTPAWSQTGAAGVPPSPAMTEAPAGTAVAPAPVPTAKPRRATRPVSEEAGIEPASGQLKLKKDSDVYSRPSRLSKKIGRVHAPKYVNVTGATKYYLRVKLKDGRVGYVPNAVVEMVKPIEKQFILTANSPVYSEPNRWAKHVAQVHKGHNVHVVGITPNYIKVKMKRGLEGFVPIAAVE